MPNPAWTREAPAFDEIQIFHIDDEKAAEIAYEAGEVDFTRVSLASLERVESSNTCQHHARRISLAVLCLGRDECG